MQVLVQEELLDFVIVAPWFYAILLTRESMSHCSSANTSAKPPTSFSRYYLQSKYSQAESWLDRQNGYNKVIAPNIL